MLLVLLSFSPFACGRKKRGEGFGQKLRNCWFTTHLAADLHLCTRSFQEKTAGETAELLVKLRAKLRVDRCSSGRQRACAHFDALTCTSLRVVHVHKLVAVETGVHRDVTAGHRGCGAPKFAAKTRHDVHPSLARGPRQTPGLPAPSMTTSSAPRLPGRQETDTAKVQVRAGAGECWARSWSRISRAGPHTAPTGGMHAGWCTGGHTSTT